MVVSIEIIEDKLTLSFDIKTDNSDSDFFAKKMSANLSDVVYENIKIIPSQGDISLIIVPDIKQIDKLGNFYRYNGNVQIVLVGRDKHELLASGTFPVDSVRKLDKNNALSAAAKNSSDKVGKWLKEKLNTIATKKIGTSVVSIKYTSEENVHKQIKKTGDKLRAMRGVISVRYVNMDSSGKKYNYRVVFLKDMFANGIDNEIYATLDANIK